MVSTSELPPAVVTDGFAATVAFQRRFRPELIDGTICGECRAILLALLLPAVLVYEQGRWRAREQLTPALWDVCAVVTAFTLAHSVTLGMASSGMIAVSPTIVEPLIALLRDEDKEIRKAVAWSLGIMLFCGSLILAVLAGTPTRLAPAGGVRIVRRLEGSLPCA